MATADLTVIGLGRPDPSAGAYIAAVQRKLAEQDKVGYRMHAMGTSLEGKTEDILAFIHAAPGTAPTSAELADYAAAQLAPYKRPTEIRLLAEMPMSPAGKILKSELRALAAV